MSVEKMNESIGISVQPNHFFFSSRTNDQVSVAYLPAQKTFSVQEKGEESKIIAQHDLDKLLRNLTLVQMAALLNAGYLHINKMSDNSYSVKFNGRIKGGGPAFGEFAYWAAKVVGNGALATAALASTAIIGMIGGKEAAAAAACGVVAVGATGIPVMAVELGACIAKEVCTAIPFMP